MKTSCSTILCLTALAVNVALGQPSPAPSPHQTLPAASPESSFSDRLQKIIQQASYPGPEPVLPKFNLDFPGGTPKELVGAIEKASGNPVNAIIPVEDADTKLPSLKMNNVDVPQLFAAVNTACQRSVVFGDHVFETHVGFKTEGKATTNSIWLFYVYKPLVPPPQKVCRFYSLAHYLEAGATVDDITTAIETGWKMLGDTNPPTISFHKDTKLLIAVGEASKLETIDAVLKALTAQVGGGGATLGFHTEPSKPKAGR